VYIQNITNEYMTLAGFLSMKLLVVLNPRIAQLYRYYSLVLKLVPQCHKGFFKFWWDEELKLLKQDYKLQKSLQEGRQA